MKPRAAGGRWPEGSGVSLSQRRGAHEALAQHRHHHLRLPYLRPTRDGRGEGATYGKGGRSGPVGHGLIIELPPGREGEEEPRSVGGADAVPASPSPVSVPLLQVFGSW